MRTRLIVVFFFVLMLSLASIGAVAARSAYVTGFSGYEISPGLRMGDTTYGVIMIGWTQDGGSTAWVDSPGDEGKWATAVAYTGSPGLGSSVTLKEGLWYWHQAGGPHRWGRVLDGTAVWPASPDASVGCGNGIARAEATVSTGLDGTPAGSLSVCLDDMRPDEVWPPRVWGVLDLVALAEQ